MAILTRIPARGLGKKRLATVVGGRRAFACAHRLLRSTIDSTAFFSTTIWYEGKDVATLQEMAPLYDDFRPQPSGTLGARMLTALDKSARVVIGSDIPGMCADYLASALTHLNRGVDLVIGPTEDGGYCLIGMDEPREELFKRISWGSNKVLQQTLSRAEKLNLSVELLPTLWDVDTPEDYFRWVAEVLKEISH